MVYYYHNGEHRVKAGCKDYPIEWWLENAKDLGLAEGDE
jgi:hypothetical protein